jgi:two-component system cell cycle response regulator DivK
MKQIRILIAEDHEDNLALMRLVMERRGFEVFVASNGRVALQIARDEHPDLIMLDLAMPEVDGWTVARELKSDPATQDILILAITAHAMPHERESAIEAGCDRVMIKPFNVSDVTSGIDEMLKTSTR